MKLEIKTLIIMLCAALMLTTACKKTPIPTEDPQPSVVDFRASSQATWVKGVENTFPYNDFGVWGIARQDNLIYNLWGNGALMSVNKSTQGSYAPSEAAYWLNGYTYNFLAVAPYADSGFTFTGVTTREDQVDVAGPSDYLTFTYNLLGKYTAGDYDFDLLGAGTQTGPIERGRTNVQELTFYHLFSQILIDVTFEGNLNGEDISNSYINAIHLSNVDTDANYTLTYDSSGNYYVSCVSGDLAKGDIELSSPVEEYDDCYVFNIVPQSPYGFKLSLDFTIVAGDEENEYKNIEIHTNFDENTWYGPNDRYKWNIKVKSSSFISFSATIIDWTDGGYADGIDSNSDNVPDSPVIIN